MSEDYSETISYFRVAFEILKDLDPSGDWQNNPLVKRYRKSRYSLTRRQALELEQYLIKELDRVHEALKPKPHQLELF